MPDFLPTHSLGLIMPSAIADEIFYQFYRVAPPSVSLVTHPAPIPEFTKEGSDQALSRFWEAFDFLVARKVERISQSGIPVSAPAGRDRILRLLEEARGRTDIPVSADFEEVIDALGALDCKRIAVAAKWDDPLMAAIEAYLKDAGVECLGHYNEAYNATQVFDLGYSEGIELATHLGATAIEKFPQADALFLAGGAWLSLQAIVDLEARFNLPVITNPTASYWSGLKQIGVAPRQAGLGILLDNLLGGQASGAAL